MRLLFNRLLKNQKGEEVAKARGGGSKATPPITFFLGQGESYTINP